MNSFLKTDSVTWAIEETNKKFAASNLEAFWKGYDFFETASSSEKQRGPHRQDEPFPHPYPPPPRGEGWEGEDHAFSSLWR